MTEAETRAEHIDPALKAAGWGLVEGSRVLREHGAGLFPHLGPESACPLCQNPLGAAEDARVEAFDARRRLRSRHLDRM